MAWPFCLRILLIPPWRLARALSVLPRLVYLWDTAKKWWPMQCPVNLLPSSCGICCWCIIPVVVLSEHRLPGLTPPSLVYYCCQFVLGRGYSFNLCFALFSDAFTHSFPFILHSDQIYFCYKPPQKSNFCLVMHILCAFGFLSTFQWMI